MSLLAVIASPLRRTSSVFRAARQAYVKVRASWTESGW
ncbi:hypothetical protein E3O21_11535 [Cryobacterium flavum]|uniref:Uncharacterized protein n=1 Tax=Cryobacterium flavum TaxID=1424659 RepID=A0ABY2I4D4_9MICO|nr:hypothetical protein E3O21_11535 [Cryobacterium flavum]